VNRHCCCWAKPALCCSHEGGCVNEPSVEGGHNGGILTCTGSAQSVWPTGHAEAWSRIRLLHRTASPRRTYSAATCVLFRVVRAGLMKAISLFGRPLTWMEPCRHCHPMVALLVVLLLLQPPGHDAQAVSHASISQSAVAGTADPVIDLDESDLSVSTRVFS
jgi:hypothetical protein